MNYGWEQLNEWMNEWKLKERKSWINQWIMAGAGSKTEWMNELMKAERKEIMNKWMNYDWEKDCMNEWMMAVRKDKWLVLMNNFACW